MHCSRVLRPLPAVVGLLAAGPLCGRIHAAGGGAAAAELGARLPLWTVAPFLLLLAAIAVLPLVAHHWWEDNRRKWCLALAAALPVALYLGLGHGAAGWHTLLEVSEEYGAFLALLGALYVITGNICLRGRLPSTALANTCLLAFGVAIASVIGTMGASVLLIRPLLNANDWRHKRVHMVVFFIFTVSNCGGLLTPLGDPPLLLGFLKGVPFGWTLALWPVWVAVNSALLAVFFLWDARLLARERAAGRTAPPSEDALMVLGVHNLLLLAAVVAVVLLAGSGLGFGARGWPPFLQELLLIALAVAAWKTTKPAVRAENGYSWTPIGEVAALFFGIFLSMAPALLILNAWGQGQREVLGFAFRASEPLQYFWATGVLTSFLDNAPTYLAFSATAAGKFGVPLEGRFLSDFLATGAEAELLLRAISCGAVLMGANTYIGNGPNFIVKAVAEQNGVKMPSFFGFMLWSVCILLPLLALVGWLFLR